MARLHEALLHICKDAQFTFLEDDYSTIEWLCDEIPMPTFNEVEQARIEVDKLKAIEKLETEYTEKVVVVKDKLFNAMMLDDQTQIAAAKAEYAQLTSELTAAKAAI